MTQPSGGPGILTRYPAGPITPAGALAILKGDKPLVAYRSYDDQVLFNMMGGASIPDRTMPEVVHITGLKGLVPPWVNIEQKGASDDGSTFVTSLYDPLEVDITVDIRGRDERHTRKVFHDWMASWDAKQSGELSWWTQDMGRWWAPVQWTKNFVDKMTESRATHQKLTWVAKAYSAFWQTFDSAAQFTLDYDADSDNFDYNINPGLNSHWDVSTTGSGGGWIFAWTSALNTLAGGQAQWFDDPAHPVLTGGRDTVCRRNTYQSATVNQVVTVTLGTLPGFAFTVDAYNDIWARMPLTGVAGANGLRLRIGYQTLELSYFVAGAKTVLRTWPLQIPPLPGEPWSLVAGYDYNQRQYTVMRNGYPVVTMVEAGTGSPVGGLSAGFGMHADVGPADPATVLGWQAGDNVTTSGSGFIPRVNPGDQDMWDRFTLYGPGTFALGNGPNATDYVQFGPLVNNQVVQIRTDPRKRSVVDLSSVPPTPQQMTQFQGALDDFISFATANNVPPLLQAIESSFGVVPPQGNVYSLMQGRFSNPVPARLPGGPLQTYQVPVAVSGANVSTRIVAAGTPYRRFPY